MDASVRRLTSRLRVAWSILAGSGRPNAASGTLTRATCKAPPRQTSLVHLRQLSTGVSGGGSHIERQHEGPRMIHHPHTRDERAVEEEDSLRATDTARVQDLLDDRMFRYESTSLLDDIVCALHEGSLEVHQEDAVQATRFPDKVVIKIANSMTEGQPAEWEVERDMDKHRIVLRSGSGTFEYQYNVISKQWCNTVDGHDLIGMLTRDLLRMDKHPPKFS